MKVIKPPPEWLYPLTCEGCTAELMAESDDVRVSAGDRNLFYIECVHCGRQTTISQLTLREDVKNKAREHLYTL